MREVRITMSGESGFTYQVLFVRREVVDPIGEKEKKRSQCRVPST
jgi:hypothetical protein